MKQDHTLARAAEIIAQVANAGPANYCGLALTGPDGYPAVSTFSIAKAEGLKRLFFCTGLGAHAPQRIAHSEKACVCLHSPEYHIALTGTAQVLTGLETKRAMWYPGLADHFSGPEDEGLCVIQFTTQRYNLLVDWNAATGEL